MFFAEKRIHMDQCHSVFCLFLIFFCGRKNFQLIEIQGAILILLRYILGRSVWVPKKFQFALQGPSRATINSSDRLPEPPDGMGRDGCRWQGMWQVGYGIKRVNMNLHTTLGDTLINNISFWWTLASIMLFLGDTTTHEKMIRRYKKLFLERYWAITSNFSCLLWTLLINYHFGDFSKLLEPTIFGMMPSLNSTYKYWIVNLWSRYCLVTLVCQMLTTLLWWFYSNPGPQIVNLESHMGDSLKCL